MRQRQCVNVYCWQLLFCDASFYVTQLVHEVGLLRLVLEKLSHLCCTSSCNMFVSKSSWFSPRCVIAWLLELNEGSFHLLLLPTSPWVLLLSHWLAIFVGFLLRELLCSHMQPSTVAGLAFICSKKLLSAWSLVETLTENLPLQEDSKRHSALFDEFHRETIEKKRDGKGSGGWQEAERGKRWEYRWRVLSGRKERTGGMCGLGRVVFSWMSGWRQMRNTNAVFSVYIKGLNQVWDYLSWSWGPCIPSKRAHISGHCSPWPWTMVGFTEPHDKWVFLTERTSPSTPFSQDHMQYMPQHSSKSHWNALFIIDAPVQSHDMKPTDRTLNKTSSNTHTSGTDIQDRTLKHTEKTTSG